MKNVVVPSKMIFWRYMHTYWGASDYSALTVPQDRLSDIVFAGNETQFVLIYCLLSTALPSGDANQASFRWWSDRVGEDGDNWDTKHVDYKANWTDYPVDCNS